MSDDLSATMLDYLAAIYRQSQQTDHPDGYVNTTALSTALAVSAPAVNRMIAKLKAAGMILHEPYQGVKLTATGELQTLLKLRGQRIAEAFLVKVMGLGWHEVYPEAKQMSNGINAALAERMLALAGNPAFCPHGEPIPSLAGTILDLHDRPLTQAKVGQFYVITRVRTREADRLEYVGALGLIPGAQLQLHQIAPFSGPLQLKLGEEYRIIGHNLAAVIWAQPVEAEQPSTG